VILETLKAYLQKKSNKLLIQPEYSKGLVAIKMVYKVKNPVSSLIINQYLLLEALTNCHSLKL
jgi:hypothetical protein